MHTHPHSHTLITSEWTLKCSYIRTLHLYISHSFNCYYYGSFTSSFFSCCSSLPLNILTHFVNTYRVKIAIWIVYGTLYGVQYKSNAKDGEYQRVRDWFVRYLRNAHSTRFYSSSRVHKKKNNPRILTHNYFESSAVLHAQELCCVKIIPERKSGRCVMM